MPAPKGRRFRWSSRRGCLRSIDNLVESVTELWDRISKGQDASGDRAAREMERIPVGVEVTVKGCRLFATQRQ